MKIFKTLFTFCLTFCLLSCAKDIIDTTGSIIGTVSDARTGEPLSGVGISISPSGKTVTTAFDGRYELRDIPAQNYNVQAAKADYQTAQKSIAVNVGEESRLDFLLMPSTPNLLVSQITMDFGSDATMQSIELSNDGYAALNWQIAENVDWLVCLPTSGRIQAGEKTSVVVSIDRSGLARGNYSQLFSIASNGGAQDVRVNMNVQGSFVAVAPEQLDFGPLSMVLPLTLKNNGTKSVAYSLSTSNAWLVLPKQSGTLVSTEQINVAVNREGLSEGDYSGEITLTADGFPIVVPVRMNIPSKSKPIVTFSGVTGVAYNEAQFTAGIVSVGGTAITRHGFCWSTSSAPTVDNNPNICNFGDCNSLKEFTYKVTGLEESTTYYVRAYAENMEGISYSNEAKFVTQDYPTTPPLDSQKETFAVNGVSFKMIKVSGGTFTMGGTSEQGADAYDSEKPTHQVTLSDYYIGEFEVTQELWQAVMGSNPSCFSGTNLPVEQVNWNDCQTFITKLNQLTGKNFSLPTEAQWEFAARGGNKSKGYKYSGSNTLGDVAWYTSNSSGSSHGVGTKAPNELGIYDMSGGVYEWCSDFYGSYSSSAATNPTGPLEGFNRVARGSGWASYERNCRVSSRFSRDPSTTISNYHGLRLVLNL